MAVQESIVTNRQDPAIEAYRLGLLADVQGYIKDQIEKGVVPPDYTIADLSENELAAISGASQGVGLISRSLKPPLKLWAQAQVWYPARPILSVRAFKAWLVRGLNTTLLRIKPT